MSRTRTFLELQDDVYERCDVVGMTNYITRTFVGDLVNQALTRLYAKIVRSGANWYLKGPTALSLTAGNSEAPAPTDCFYVKGVDTLRGSEWVNAHPFNFEQRNDFQVSSLWSAIETRVFYDVRKLGGTNGPGNTVVYLLPAPASGDQARIWYYPNFARLTDNAHTFDGVNGWERYVVEWAAAKVAEKEESFQMAQAIMASADRILAEIIPEVSQNIIGHARTPVRSRRRNGNWWAR